MCIYGCIGQAYNQVYHIVPESIANYTFVAKPGLVCDRCNSYFANKLDGPFIKSFQGGSTAVLGIAATKKGRPRRHSFSTGDMLSVPMKPGMRQIGIPGDSIAFSLDDDGGITFKMYSNSLYPWNPKITSRFLYRIAFESICNDGRATLHEPIRANVIQYVREGRGKQTDFPFLYRTGNVIESAPSIEVHYSESQVAVLATFKFPGVEYVVPFILWQCNLTTNDDAYTLVQAKNERISCIEVSDLTAKFKKLNKSSINSAQQGDAPKPATNANPALRPPSAPAR